MTLAIVSLAPFSIALAQTGIPAADGGFENVTVTFAGNSWSTALPGAARQWQVGTAGGSVAGGTRAAYVGAAANFNGASAAQTGHFYRDVVIPGGATNVFLNFSLKMTNTDATFDFIKVYTTTTANTPVSGVTPGAGYVQRFSNDATIYAAFTAMTPINLTALAGSTVRLVFTNISDGVAPVCPIAVDNISLNYTLPSCTAPSIGTVTNTTNCAAGTFSVTVPINTLGDAPSVSITASPGPTCGTCTGITGVPTTRTLTFPIGTPQTITVVHNGDATCNTNLGTFNSATDPDETCLANGVYPIADGACINVPFCLSSAGTQLGTNVLVKSVDIMMQHQAVQDLDIQLTDPFGTTVNLVNDRLGNANNLGVQATCPTGLFTLQDGGTALPNSGANNTQGVFQPEQSLTLFNDGSNPNGTWTLRVCDDAVNTFVGNVRYIRVNLCTPPLVTFTSVDNCANQQFSVAANVTSIGAGPTVTVQYSVNGGSPVSVTGLGLGTTNIGPFAVGDQVVLSANNGPGTCALASSTRQSNCAVLIECGNTAVVNHCYGNFDPRTFTFTTTSVGETVTATFLSGTMAAGDVIRAYDGTDNTGTPLPGLTGSFANLTNATATSISESIFIEIQSDGSNSCQTGQQTSWQFEVQCTNLTCSPATASATVNANCSLIDVEVFDPGNEGSTTLQYIVNGGSPQTWPATLFGGEIVTLGPFIPGQNVQIILLHPSEASCNKNLGTFLIPAQPSPIIVVATATPSIVCPNGNSQLMAGPLGNAGFSVIVGNCAFQ
ncbi:MAG TPA: proprotein convertase P-domain-containing protein, partial [Flavobacteriales bacterium]|nr:proprotein convertase P-domain-containing protein [Flavobacteriales bacterium]